MKKGNGNGNSEEGSFKIKISTQKKEIDGNLSKDEIEIEWSGEGHTLKYESQKGHKFIFEKSKLNEEYNNKKKQSQKVTKLLIGLEAILIVIALYEIFGNLT